MRKIGGIFLDDQKFELVLKIRNENGEVVSFPTTPSWLPRYERIDWQNFKKLDEINLILHSNGQQLLTQEEAENYLRPYRHDDATEAELQRLAGFSVSKSVTIFDDQPPKTE